MILYIDNDDTTSSLKSSVREAKQKGKKNMYQVLTNNSVDVLVNGNKCKQYTYDGKIYIEAKASSAYEIKINNNGYGRILAVVSVDGLSVLTGKPASLNDAGYIINANDSYRIKGFRYDNDKVGAFKFVCKNESYAAGISNKAKRNCGIIGIVLYEEKIKPVVTWTPCCYPPLWPTITTTSNPCLDIPYGSNNATSYGGASSVNNTLCNYNNSIDDYRDIVRSKSSQPMSSLKGGAPSAGSGFDMGSGWGNSVESKVVSDQFERGNIVYQSDIYYASREALIDMGVPVKKEGKVSYPKSFPSGYATPPSGWCP
jgi:hypothetical protein